MWQWKCCTGNQQQQQQDNPNWRSVRGNHDPCQHSDYWISSILTPAAGSRSVGSAEDHGALYTVLPMGESGCHDNTHVQNRESMVRQVIPQQQQQQRPPPANTHLASEEAASCRQVVGTTAAVVEPNWDIDHDYTSESLPVDCSIRLTPDEENLITELTSALSEVPVSDIGQACTDNITNSQVNTNHTVDDVSTPDIIKDFFDFGMDVNVIGEGSNHKCPSIASSKTNNPIKPQPPLSPISKEQILDFLEDKAVASPQYGSESGYESSLSPRSLGSLEESEDQGMELDSFIELFPSLF